ncbi:ABC transporter ATP-binding protein [candidate division WWE3 bacterium CG_4_9_14_3_um_filter_41_6]|uniref:ABC transporter ATP-binding protein n=1 Tax=candidate division WWE3 bacterium CG_4_10_14_0_2_um_filter_41_14 TaxID=1975072 RepID=A0A2M7TJ78_UNCKA|nr:MAG: ABC transporter ATP-binding protein [candidate division WWE3 bacterium CG_4_10_14_0_2_um_filter_41_14]PJA39419.1 MAG: ABC transporter ATP-binding protein [candidate division WWE3 bacterium CG_4_9_14_3_um_filter_41_6]
MKLIELSNVGKVFSGTINVPVLFDINLTVEQGEFIAIKGPSGSGKSTLMNIIGLLDRPTSGTMKLEEKEITLDMSDKMLAHLRAAKIGFVFQSFNLLPRLSALENVLVPSTYGPTKKNTSSNKKRAEKFLESVGLTHRLNHKPNELSGGEKQRVAIARALINDPDLILADEPTGNLDSKSGQEVLSILTDLHRKGKTIIIITHDNTIASATNRVVLVKDGRIE